jgi:hypothetical protein
MQKVNRRQIYNKKQSKYEVRRQNRVIPTVRKMQHKINPEFGHIWGEI